MAQGGNAPVVGTRQDDTIVGDDFADTINGNAGNDTIITEDGNDLVAGDLLGEEWRFVDGIWVYDPSRINFATPLSFAYNDVITAGGGDDIILGNGGNDRLSGDNGNDLINAGTGNDEVFGGKGADILNLEDGFDTAEGGDGADIINAGGGDDLVYGDSAPRNLLAMSPDDSRATSFAQFAGGGNWEVSDAGGRTEMSQSFDILKGQEYTLTFGFAANVDGGLRAGRVEVLWNDQSLGVFDTTSGVFETISLDIVADSRTARLTFRELEPPGETGPELRQNGEVWYFDKQVEIGGESVTVAAFAPGQARLYQVITGNLKVFDTEAQTYADLGEPTGILVNAIGYNQEDDLIYGLAKSPGVDALGNAVATRDLVMLDAKGLAYRVGKTSAEYFVGDFDDAGNLWTFDSRLRKVKVFDVSEVGPDGRVAETVYNLPSGLIPGQIYDIAFAAEENAFYGIAPPSRNGGNGSVLRIDLSDVDHGGAPQVESVPINRTLFGADFRDGMPKGAYGAVFRDGDGNLFFGLNRGDHDLDGATGAAGGIYKVHVDWAGGAAYAQFMAEAERTGANDGAVDPRSADAFSEVDTTAPFLLRDPLLVANSGADDTIRGAEGEDRLFGGAGDDDINGGRQADIIHGDDGADRINGGLGADLVYGGRGNDRIIDQGGSDRIFGDEGGDYIHGGLGNDRVNGGAGRDKLVGGAGSDTLVSGEGVDFLWGGDFEADGESDLFVFGDGDGRDYIHDFEVGVDRVDLTAFGIDFATLEGLFRGHNGNTVIRLYRLDGAEDGDKVVLVGVDPATLGAEDFVL